MPIIHPKGAAATAIGPPASIAFISDHYNAGMLITHSFTVDVGAAEDGRRVGCWVGAGAAGNTISSATINGVSATIHVQNSFLANGIFSAPLGDAVSGNITIAVTFNVAVSLVRLGVWKLLNTADIVADAQGAGSAVNSQSVNLNVPANSVQISGYHAIAAGSWTGTVWTVDGGQDAIDFDALPLSNYVQTGIRKTQSTADAALSFQCRGDPDAAANQAAIVACGWASG